MHDLTRGPVAAHLRRQAIPFSLGLLAIFSFEAVDLFFISRLGDAPLAAVSFTFPIIWLGRHIREHERLAQASSPAPSP